MIKTFTENDLVRFLYDELSNKKTQALEDALLTDGELRSQLEALRSIVNDLEKVTYSPSRRSVNKILNFSKGYHEESV